MAGLLSGRFFQMAYVTNDFDRALVEFGKKANIARFFEGRDSEFEVGPGRQAKAHVALAFVGGIQIEIIQPLGGHDQVYRQILSGDGYQLHHHHEAHVLDTIEEFVATKEAARIAGYEIVIEADLEPYRYFYADTRAFLGHHLEFFYFTEDAIRYFNEVVPVS